LVSIFTRHTTAILKINEAEDGFWNDLKKWCDKYVSIDERYQHNDLENRDPKTMCNSKEECLNGHSHIRAMLIGNSSETIPVKEGILQFGVWQRLLLIELDHARPRNIIFSYI
jgi:secondary thiamine-phosphate synthase enzyme